MRNWLRAGLFAACCAFAASDAGAVGTRQFVLDSLRAFEGGDLAGVSIASDGTVRAGWTLGAVPIADATSAWGAVSLPDGTALVATGVGARLYQLKGGTASIAAEMEAMAVSAIALGWDGDVVAGTFPDGKIYRSAPGKLDGKMLQPWTTLEGVEDVWALAFDAKNKALFAATGPDGKLFRITADGKSEVFFDSDEAHLVSLAVSKDGGTVYAGSNGNALLYKLAGPGRAEVLYDFEGDDVKAIALADDGSLYAVANEYRGGTKGLRPKKGSGGITPAPQDTKPTKGGNGKLFRFDARGVGNLVLENDDAHFVALALDDKGVPHVGTGAEGRVYAVDGGQVERLVADTEERQIGALQIAGRRRFIVGSDPVSFHEITGEGGVDAIWTSKVLDASLRAQFGLLDFRSEGTLELETRSGNTEKPDDTWSPWSRAMAAPGKVTSPAARFLQVRARWSRDAKAVLQEVRVAFVTDNARALVTEVAAGDSESDEGGKKVPESGGPPGEASTKVKLRWKVDNPDSDKLLYRLFYRPLEGKNWFAVLPSDTEHTSTDYTWDTSGLPEGRYRVRVDASDELANPPDRTTRHSLESRSILIDNTAPVLGQLEIKAGRLKGTVTDGAGPIARVELSVVGGKSWWPLFPTDSVFDEAREAFDSDVSSVIPAGATFVVVRAYDAAGNSSTRTVSTP